MDEKYYRLGQAAPRDLRKKDMRLKDADLSPTGINQAYRLAKAIKKIKEKGHKPELVMSSPLTRALKTALTAFDEELVVVHPGLAELNSRKPIPENLGRPIHELRRDENLLALGLNDAGRVDLSHAEALKWPNPSFIDGLDFLRTRSEDKIVIFTHHNYILSHLGHLFSGGVDNCEPIHARIKFSSNGHVIELAQDPHPWCDIYGGLEEQVYEEN